MKLLQYINNTGKTINICKYYSYIDWKKFTFFTWKHRLETANDTRK